MSAEYQNQDPIKLATQAEQDLNSHTAKHGHNADLSSNHGHGASDSSKSPESKVEVCSGICSLLLSGTLINDSYNMLTLSSTAAESGVDESIRNKFPGADVTYGSAASGAGNNRDIPLSEGGDINPSTGKLYKAGDFEGAGGPETKAQIHRENAGGNDEVRSNIRN